MPDLGELGTRHEPAEPLTFGYLGSVIRTNPALTDVKVMRLVSRLADAERLDGREAVAAFGGILEALIHPDDLEEFWEVAERERQTLDDLGDVIEQIMSGVTERPTERPSGSSDGPQTTEPSSPVASSLPALTLLKDRPDLAVLLTRDRSA